MEIVKIKPSIFREYDIRGIYEDDIDANMAYTLGKGFGSYIQNSGETKTIVGYDNRMSSPILNDALIKGITSTGVDVVELGLVTTPMYYFARKKLDFETGMMITASHNPKEYNGFKFAFDSLSNACGDMIYDFRDFIEEGNFKSGNGNISNYDIKDEYINLLKDSLDFGDKQIKIVIDCGNGTAAVYIKEILDSLNIHYYPLYCDSDPDFPNHHPDPTVSENMQDLKNKVLELGYDLGIGIDGDGDRVGVVDEKGNIIPTDIFMIPFYRDLRPSKGLFDVKCSRTLKDELDKLGIEKTMYRTGNSYMSRMVVEGDFIFAGEYSGHVWFRDKFPGLDDGVYGGLRMVELLSKSDKSLSELLQDINKYYSTEEIKIRVTDENKFGIVNKMKEYSKSKGYEIFDIDGVRAEFDDGWALIRASNTGPNITTRFEATTKERLEEIKTEFMNELESYLL